MVSFTVYSNPVLHGCIMVICLEYTIREETFSISSVPGSMMVVSSVQKLQDRPRVTH